MSTQPDIQAGKQSWSQQTGGPRPARGGLIGVLLVLGVVFGALLALGVVPRLVNQQELKHMHEETAGAVPVVHTVVATPAPFTEQGLLPANIGAMQYATIYARVDGYLTKRLVDIGDFVKEGQLLAVIDTPTIDEELAQSKADLAEARSQVDASQAKLKQAKAQAVAAQAQVDRAKANESYASVTAGRWENMASRGAVSLQSRDEKERSFNAETANVKAAEAQAQAAQAAVSTAQSDVQVSRATVVAKKAAVRRFQAQQSFKNVVAPFDGVITLRKVDPGQLITAGSQSSNLELFQIAKLDVLRVYTNAPQTYAPYLKAGQKAEVLVPEFPGRLFAGEITHVSGALDPSTRTRQTEIRVPNPDHALLPGMYGQVRITAHRDAGWIKVSGTCLVARPEGMFVVVALDNKAHYQKVDIGRDFGDEVEISSGLKGGEQVIVSPPVDLREGEPVKLTPIASS